MRARTLRPHIHFHSHCASFAGCENMLQYCFQDEEFRRQYRITFSYQQSPVYEAGFRRRVGGQLETLPCRFLDLDEQTSSIEPAALRGAIKAVSYALLVPYWYVLWNMFVLYRIFRRCEIDVLHVNNGGYPGARSCLSAVLAARLCEIPAIVYVVNNMAQPYTSPSRWLDFPLDRLAVALVSRFVTGSEAARKRLVTVLGVPAARVAAIHNGSRAPEITETRQAVRERLGAPEDGKVIVVGAALELRKGHMVLLRALRVMREELGLRELPLVLCAGDGPERARLEEFAGEAEISDRVRFIGHEPRMMNLLAAADIVALPSIGNEDFPFVILEAMSLGKAIVATTVAGIPEQIEDGRSGLLVRPADVYGLANALSRLMADEPLRGVLGENAAARFSLLFQARTAVDKYRALYSSLLAHGDGGQSAAYTS
jgi:glycosyltransferase involved in cell wall biosynthesis